jgi:hypothetical protein
MSVSVELRFAGKQASQIFSRRKTEDLGVPRSRRYWRFALISSEGNNNVEALMPGGIGDVTIVLGKIRQFTGKPRRWLAAGPRSPECKLG